MSDCIALEACHTGKCGGLDEVIALLPTGQIWQIDRDSVYTNYIRALGHIKTELNKRICAVWVENNACTATRLLPFWADFYNFPDCLQLTQEKLCDWVKLVTDETCLRGSLGFLQSAIDFVLPGAGVTISINQNELFGNLGGADSVCANRNTLVVTGAAEFFAFEENPNTPIYDQFDAQDGVNGCRRYFIPEIECLRRCVLPLSISVGYKTADTGPQGQDIFGVPDTAKAVRIAPYLICEKVCDGNG